MYSRCIQELNIHRPWILRMRDRILRMTLATEEVVVPFSKIRETEKDQIWDLRIVKAGVKMLS